MKTISFVAWTPYQRRSDNLAQQLGASLHFVSCGKRGSPAQAPLRYLRQARRTWRILNQEQPDVVLVQNPPIFCALVAFYYTRQQHSQYVIDSHTGAFLDRKWSWTLPLHRLLSRRALLTLVHNRSQQHVVADWGCRYFVLPDPLGDYPVGIPYALTGQFNVAVISSFAGDEPLDVVVQAAVRSPDVQFYVTGDSRRAPPGLLTRKPENVHLTGFLSEDKYVGLLRGVDAIMVLTMRDHTLLCGAFEAVSLGTPLIISDWPVLKEYFTPGAVYVCNTAEGICEGMRRAKRDASALRRDVLVLQERLQTEWQQKFSELQQMLETAP